MTVSSDDLRELKEALSPISNENLIDGCISCMQTLERMKEKGICDINTTIQAGEEIECLFSQYIAWMVHELGAVQKAREDVRAIIKDLRASSNSEVSA